MHKRDSSWNLRHTFNSGAAFTMHLQVKALAANTQLSVQEGGCLDIVRATAATFYLLSFVLFAKHAQISWLCANAWLESLQFQMQWLGRHFYNLLWNNIPHMSLTYSTHTQVNSQSQIRWQIRRLILLGGCGIGSPPSPSGRAPKHSRNLTHAS